MSDNDKQEHPESVKPIKKSARIKLNPAERKLFVKLAACLVVGVLLMNFSGGGGGGDDDTAVAEPVQQSQPADDLAKEIGDVLSRIKGAGEVHVVISYERGEENIYAYDSEQRSSEDSSEQKNTLVSIDDSPILLTENPALAQGIVVVAGGAADPVVKERLYQAVRSLLSLPANKIAVIEGE